MSKSQSQPPIGQRFSQVYLERGEPTADSKRMRQRLMHAVLALPKGVREAATDEVPRRLGVPFHSYISFFGEAAVRDLLDFVTIAYPHAVNAERFMAAGTAKRWLEEVRQIFAEENLHYRFDDAGGAHFSFDKEFSFNVASAIAALGPMRYENVRREFDLGQKALAKTPPDGKSAIRATFTAIEGLFCLMFPGVHRLAAGEVSHLSPAIVQIYAHDQRAQETAGKLMSSFRGWIDAAHGYRHEEGRRDTVAQPPLTLAVYLVSTGAAHLRWLAEIDAHTTAIRGTAPAEPNNE